MKLHRNIPFGYMMQGGEITLHPEESAAVRELFDMYLHGMSIKSIAAAMTVPYNTDKPLWNKNMVSRMLENERYIGSDGFPPIVDSEVFRKANEIKQQKAAACVCTDEKKKYLRSLVSGSSSLAGSDVERLLVSVINKLIRKPKLAAPGKQPGYVPDKKIAEMEERLTALMLDMTADIDEITRLIADTAAAKYDLCPYDNRDKTLRLLDILTGHEPITELDLELSRQVVKGVYIDNGIAAVELINGKKIKE